MTVLAIVAHPDDEVLGAGGTLARHAVSGEAVHIAFLADGVASRGHGDVEMAERADAARSAARTLKAHPPRFLGFPDQRLDGIDLLDLVQAVEGVIKDIQPDTIYTHHHGDLNLDHAICHRAVMTACRPQRGSSVRRIYAMEIASSTEWNSPLAGDAFLPNRFVDIAATSGVKRRALEAYAREMRPFPHSRSFEALEALARWRGATVGFEAAEAFMIVRELET